eukprot:CAMPEP_0185575932 /NCGR_PEP_ID=MMETSP0434-20130131/6989_1 /TAXON_ID=626734 ORGANISM="Favella taraikaensis, Strain Fe Narragansett Bay" /NCGR_SAMPLE_ID=MMETSP0434 /ASSEMBLY_ACC=CAM_ASM_000379 /LENGTH=75 /DNA_ID=CAMNT_0028192959 /DNA_START=1550 /DNA_END=1777 /DNA_ORIENTATION=+
MAEEPENIPGEDEEEVKLDDNQLRRGASEDVEDSFGDVMLGEPHLDELGVGRSHVAAAQDEPNEETAFVESKLGA